MTSSTGAAATARLGLPVYVDNDANLVALAELWFGAGRSLSDFAVVTIEHGVGMGFVMNHRIYRGPQPLAPRDDDIRHVLDYRKVRQIVIDECTARHVNLLESLVGKLCTRLLQLPGVQGVRVRIVKLEIFEDCEVAIRMEAGRW